MKNRAQSGGYILLATLFMLATLVLLAGALAPVILNEINSQKRMESAIRLNDMDRAVQAYFWDTGQLPAGTDSAALSRLVTNVGNVAGWHGPYSAFPANYAVRDPWLNPFIYRTGLVGGIPVVLLGSGGANGSLDTDLLDWPNTPLTVSGDDMLTTFQLDRLSEFQDEKTRNVLNLTKSLIYSTFTEAPLTYTNSTMLDAWGTEVQYERCQADVGVLYSFGYNRADESNGGTDICVARRSSGDDLFVWLAW